ncbi:hypothetical protein ACSXAB_07085 [Clostridium perfringens]|uniref:hypothetical protein n=1 Tax=Clostridium perfringens TaxID=1502 RepID=UPI001A185DF9|nr:hypothetical protein [Clostridium perfringens]HAT4161936.1 hypothetical protein [Clostridium perfringens]
MSITSYERGHEIFFDGIDWRYSDNKKIINGKRACKKCGMLPTKEGYDACLKEINGVISACCGHGVEKGYVIKRADY